MTVSDEEFIKLYDMAERAEKEGCYAASMKLELFKTSIRNLYNYQQGYLYGLDLRQISVDDKTVYLGYKKLRPSVIITLKLVPFGYVGEFKKTSWRQYTYLEFQADNTCKKVTY
jgi:hypothetical protein